MAGDASDAVQAALQDALNTDVDSQSTNEPSPDVADALKNALKPEGDSAGASDDAAGDEGDDGSDKDKGKKDPVPYDRLSKVVKQKNEAVERSKTLESQLKSATDREAKLQSEIDALKTDVEILDSIKNLAQDPKYRPAVEQIDRALQGIDEEVDEARAEGDTKAESAALKKLEAKTSELEDLLADQRAEKLWDSAAARAKEMLAGLPEEYTDEDRELIGKLWTPKVDWNLIEANGSDAIPGALNSSFAEVIREYKTPKGALVANTTKEIESRVPEARVVSPEDAIKNLLERDWAERDGDGNAVISEDEFNKGLAEMIRKTQGR